MDFKHPFCAAITCSYIYQRIVMVLRQKGYEDTGRCFDYQIKIWPKSSCGTRTPPKPAGCWVWQNAALRLLKKWCVFVSAKAGQHIGAKRRASEKLWHKIPGEGEYWKAWFDLSKAHLGKLTCCKCNNLSRNSCKDQDARSSAVCDYVEKKPKVHYTTRGSMAYVFERLKVKTGRPLYHHKDFKGEKEFKKKVPELKKDYDVLILQMSCGSALNCKRIGGLPTWASADVK